VVLVFARLSDTNGPSVPLERHQWPIGAVSRPANEPPANEPPRRRVAPAGARRG